MARKAPRKPTHYNKKSNARTKEQSSVPLKYAFDELVAHGYEVVQAPEGAATNKKAKSLALAWFYAQHPNADYSNSGRTVRMSAVYGKGDDAYESVVNLPVSEGQLSKHALKDLRRRTGLNLNPILDAEDDLSVPRVGEVEAASKRFDKAVMAVYELYASIGADDVSEEALARFEEQVNELLIGFAHGEQKRIKDKAQEMLLEDFATPELPAGDSAGAGDTDAADLEEDDDDFDWGDDDEVYVVVTPPRP